MKKSDIKNKSENKGENKEENKNFIICTAGHVDHGKTALVKALTDFDCDTHPEEQLRGITINPGFAFFDRVAIIDLPGHHDFIHNMLAGVFGVDLGLLVVAANEGVKAQTIEHLQILKLIGIRSILIVVTKIDLVRLDELELLNSQLREFSDALDIVNVSIKNKDSIDKLKQIILQSLIPNKVNKVKNKKHFHMYIDRAFSIKGHGSVVTGTILSGTVRVGQELHLIAIDKNNKTISKTVQARYLENHYIQKQQMYANQRVSINITNFHPSEYARGMLLTDKEGKDVVGTSLIDVRLRFINFVDKKTLRNNSLITFFFRTQKVEGKIRFLEKNSNTNSSSSTSSNREDEECWAQIELFKKIIIFFQDPFIIRHVSGTCTLGGGVVVDPYPLRHLKYSSRLIELLNKRVSGNFIEVVEHEVEKYIWPLSINNLAKIMFVNPCDFDFDFDYDFDFDFNFKIEEEINVCMLNTGKEYYFFSKSLQSKWQNKILSLLDSTSIGMDIVALTNAFSRNIEATLLFQPSEIKRNIENALPCFLEEMLKLNLIFKSVLAVGNVATFISNKFLPSYLESKTRILSIIKKCIDKVDSKVVSKSELEAELTKSAGLDIKEAKIALQLLEIFVKEGELIQLDDADNYILPERVDRIRKRLLQHLLLKKENKNKDGVGVTIAEFRDLINSNRKTCLLLINKFDSEGVTSRVGDERVITEKGLKILTTIATTIMITIIVLLQTAFALPNPNNNLEDINENHKIQFDHPKDKELIYFWATWCVSCKDKLQSTLIEMNQRKDLAVITVNIDEDIDRAKHYIKKNKIALPVLHDKSGEYIKDLKVVAAPHWAIYKQGKNNKKWTLLIHEEGFDLDKINNFLQP
ncbi:MAG: selenocysteine-specific translation elongation factor [Oligoflexia bacterium]|nr:selenocysteine-specific translation elongation factor [Oligoflexia bacterium]